MGFFGSESKFESSVKQIPYPQQAVYDNISDLRNLEKVRDRVPEDKVNDFSFDQDTVSLNVPPVVPSSFASASVNSQSALSLRPCSHPYPSTCGYRCCPSMRTTRR